MRETLKKLSFKKKIEYLWEYYKIWLLVPVGIWIVVYIGFSAYKASQENVLVSAIVVGSTSQDTEELQKELKDYMKKDGKNDTVTLHMNIPADQLAQTSQVALTTLIGAEAVDVMVSPQDVYEQYSAQGGYVSIQELLGEEASEYEGLELTERGDAFVIRGSEFLKEKLGTPYNEVYISVFVNAQHEEGAKAFVQYVLDNQ